MNESPGKRTRRADPARKGWILACFLLTGCMAPSIDPDWAEAAAERHDVPSDAETATDSIADRLLSGFDATYTGEDQSLRGIQSGDRVLYRLTRRSGDEVRNEWLIRVTARPNPAAKQRTDGRPRLFRTVRSLVRARVEVFDAAGRPLSERVTWINRNTMQAGLMTACGTMTLAGSAVDPSDKAKAKRAKMIRTAYRTITGFVGMVRRDKSIESAFWEVVRIPSLWSMITNLGVKIELVPRLQAATRTAVPVSGEDTPAWNVPFQVLGNEQPVLLASMQVVEPKPPRAICAGIVSMIVTKPGDPKTCITMRLLAARRTPAPR